MNSSLASADWIVIGLYFLMMVCISIYFAKKIKGQESFAIADRSLTMPVMIGTTFATVLGAGCAFGDVGFVYDEGASALIAIAMWNVGWIALVAMSKRLRASGAMSLPDFLEMKYGRTTKTLSAVVTLTMVMNTTAAQVAACGTIVVALGLASMKTGIIVGGILIILYTIFGGLYAVAWTDTIQSVLIFVGILIAVPVVAWREAGGIGEVVAFHAKTNPEMISFTSIAPIALLGYALSYMLAAGANPSYAQRILASKDEGTAFWGSVWSNLSTLILCVPLEATALCMPLLFPNLGNGELTVPTVIFTYFPPIAKGIIIAALLALVVTTADTYLLLLSTTISNDICRVIKPDLSSQSLLKISRATTLIGGVLAILLALYGQSVFLLFRMGAAAYGAGMFVPLVCALYWKRVRTIGVNWGMCVGCALTIFWNFFVRPSTDIEGVIPGALACLIITVAISLLVKKDDTNLNHRL